MKGYFTTSQWIQLLRALPPHGAILDAGSLRRLAGLGEKAGRQALWRLGRGGLMTHLGNGWYTHAFARPAVEELAALLVAPSYVSLETVLARRGVTTQRSAFLTCVTLSATQSRRTPLGEIRYHKVARDLFWGFDHRSGPSGLTYCEAWPEKALLDHIYLARKRGHRVWLDLDFNRLDPARLEECGSRFPQSVRQMLEELRITRALVS